jgi:galactose oxidase-like protein/Kelch motif protein
VRTAVALLLLALLPATAGAGGVPVLPAGPVMSVERAAHTATRLPDGMVLVAGGFRPGEVTLASAELFDPQTGTFSPTGQMTSVRSGHTATLLKNGFVLLSGGFDDEAPLRTAELYDPATGRFERTGSLRARRGGATATLLRDGRVLVAGGYDGDRSLASADLYDPRTGRFSRTGALRAPRAAHTATRLRDGRVLMTGGGNLQDRVLRSAEIYDPRTGRFSATGSLMIRRHKHAAALLRDGRVLVLGGSDERDWGNRYRSAELFNPRTGRFSRAAALSRARFKFPDAVVVMPSGAVLVAGGAEVVERFGGGRFASVALLDAARYNPTATLLRGGEVLIAGGYDRSIKPTAQSFLYRP